MSETVATMVQEAKAGIQNLTPSEVSAEAEAGALLIDVREEDERRINGVIPGSVPAPRGMLEFYADPASPYYRPEFRTDRRIVLVCASGGRSALATATLHRMGYHDVAHLDGGIRAWVEAGYAVDETQ